MPMAPVSRTLPVVKSQLSFEIPFSSSTDQFQDPHKLGIQYHHLHQHNHNHKHKHNNNNRHSHSSHSHCQSRSYNHSNRYQEHRPDSPTSLEDSQSDSSLDSLDCSSDSSASFENETLKEPNPLLLKKHKDAHTDRLCATALVPLAQVATPPLSPAQPQFDQSSVQHQDAAESQDDILELSLTGGPSSPRHHDPITDNTNFTQETSSRAIDARKASSSDSKEVALDPLEASSQGLSQLEEKASTADMSTPVPALASEPESTFTPTPTPTCTSTPTGAPTPGAWQSLLPGVAPTPAPAPTAPTQSWSTLRSTSRASARSMGGYKSAEQRLHELLPIVLPPEYEDKLSMEMIDLFESLLPTEESHNRRTRLIKKIEDILHQEWPDQDIKAQPFGSTVNGLGTSTSDVDLCITTTWPGLNNVQMLANAFRKHGMEKVFCVPNAKVPIVKLWDPELHLSCDMNINTPLGLLNTRMIKTYVAIDPRVRPFAMIIKHWARKRVLDDAANGGTISTYTWICIVINFLQMRSPPILPALHDIPHTLSPDNQVVNGNNTSFCEDLSKLEGFGYANKESLGGLLYAFFRRFAIEFDYDHHVISVRHGCYLTKESKDWHIQGKHYKLFCVEEPLDTSRNLGNSSDMASSKGLKQEFRRALDILFQKGSLYQCCEQWVFPPIFYSSNNFRNGDNSGYHHTHHAAGRRYALGYRNQNNYQYYNNNNNSNHTNSSVMNSSHHGYHESQTDVEENDENESKQQSRHDRSFAQFRSMATPVPFVPGSDGQYRTGRSNSAPRLDVPSQSGFRSGSNKNPPVPYSGLAGQSGGGGGSMSNKSSAHWSPPSKNGQASSFGGGSFLEQDPFAAPVPVKHSRNRSKSVSAVDHYNGIVACRPPVKHDKATASLASGVTTNANDTAALPVHSNNSRTGGQGSTGNHRPRRSKSSNRGGDGSKQGNSYSSDHTSNQQQRHAHGHTNGNNHTGGHTNGTGKQHGRSHTNNHNHNHNHGHGHGHTATNGNGQSLRAAVEFNLADIAPKAMLSSTASLVSKGTDASSGQSRPSDVKKGGHNRRHNVVWSTNSNRGDSRGTHSSVSPSSGHGNHHKGVQSASQDSLSDDS